MIKSTRCIEHTVNNLLPFNIIIIYLYSTRYSISSRGYCYILRPCFIVNTKNKTHISKWSWWHIRKITSIEITNKWSVTRTETLLWNRCIPQRGGPITTEEILWHYVCVLDVSIYMFICGNVVFSDLVIRTLNLEVTIPK